MPRPKKSVAQRRQASKKGIEAIKKKKKVREAGVVQSSGSSEAVTPVPPPPPPPVKETSSRKRKRLTYEEPAVIATDTQNLIIKQCIMETIAMKVPCPQCFEPGLDLKITRNQVDASIRMKCQKCEHVVIDTHKDSQLLVRSKQNRHIHPVTLMIIYAVMLLGYGYRGVERVCGMISLRHFSRAVYMDYANYLTSKVVENAKSVLEKSRKAVVRFYAEKLDRHPNSDGVLDIDVSFDGTWHTRGHKSLLGASAVIDANTGLVIDYEVFCKSCVICNSKKGLLSKKKITREAYDTWYTEHIPNCEVNYGGSAGGMEPAGAVNMFGRSVSHGLRYMHFVSDGDATTYKHITEMNNNEGPYGKGKENRVEKWDCINHVAKRLGTALRNLCKSTSTTWVDNNNKKRKTTLGGRNKLTDATISRLQHYFRVSIVRKVNTTEEEMRNEILSSFYHCSSTDANPQHHLCPKHEKSFCFYQAAIAKGETPGPHTEMQVFFRLPADDLALVKTVYDRLTTDDMMKRCLQGLTQNPNESFHSRVWRYCPKHINATKTKLEFSVAVATSEYNVGYVASNVNNLLGLEYTQVFDKHLKEKDKMMDRPTRRKMRNKKLQRELDYEAGAH